jgi:hypothetical protein
VARASFAGDCKYEARFTQRKRRVSGKFHWAETVANRHGFLTKIVHAYCPDESEGDCLILCE